MRKCTICTHPKSAEIDYSLAAGTSHADIANTYGVGRASVQRHAVNHLADKMKVYQAGLDEQVAINVSAQLQYINELSTNIMKAAYEKQDYGLALMAIDRIGKQIELQARLLGIIRPRADVYLCPDWQHIRDTINRALAPYPDARIAVAAALVSLEGN